VNNEKEQASMGELALAKFVSDFIFKLFGLKTEQKLAVATYLGKIADILSKFGPAFRQNDRNEMNELIGETRTIAEKFEEVAKGTLPTEDIKKLSQGLTSATISKEILGSGPRDNPLPQDEVNKRLAEIADIAGLFRGLSINIEAMAHCLG
jgi:hypothetical protein